MYRRLNLVIELDSLASYLTNQGDGPKLSHNQVRNDNDNVSVSPSLTDVADSHYLVLRQESLHNSPPALGHEILGISPLTGRLLQWKLRMVYNATVVGDSLGGC